MPLATVVEAALMVRIAPRIGPVSDPRPPIITMLTSRIEVKAGYCTALTFPIDRLCSTPA